MSDLWSEITADIRLLERAIEELKPRGQMKATTERDYRMALAKKILEMRAEGTPATLIGDLSRGQEDIANLKMQRDIAETLYESALEAINVYKLKIRILESQLSREWGNAR